MNILHYLRAGASLVLAAAASGATGARAATFTIPNGDVAALQGAIRAASTNGQPDTISLAPNGTYILTRVDNVASGPNGLPIILPDSGFPLTIQGNGATLARSPSAPAFRLALVRAGSQVSISKLTLRNGSTTDGGGCFNNEGSLSLNSCALLSSASGLGGAAVNFGTMNLATCLVSGNRARFSGGVSNYARLNIISSTISRNTSVYGGGGVGSGFRAVLNVSGSTFSQNRAEVGGAIHNYGATATLFQCTLSGNVAVGRGGGILSEGARGDEGPLNASLSVRACTITLNGASQGGGLNNLRGTSRATLLLRSSIVAGNSDTTSAAAPGADLTNNDVLQNGGFNLIGGASGLAPLASNGGPTMTHALLPGSRALNMGDTAPASPYDQRGVGFARASGGRADIGAFEVQPAAPSNRAL